MYAFLIKHGKLINGQRLHILVSKKCYLFVQMVKRLKLNFSLEKFKFASPPMVAHHTLVQIFLQFSSWYLNVPNIWDFPRNSFEFLRNSRLWHFGKCCSWFLQGKCAAIIIERFSEDFLKQLLRGVLWYELRLRLVIILKRAYLSFTGIS